MPEGIIKRQFYVTEKIGPKQSLTPEGFLLCEEVPVGRTGLMIYGPGEVPIEPNKDGIIKIQRSAEETFNPKTLASINGKPMVDDHPPDDVTPETWNTLAVGVALSPRRGVGSTDDLLLCDLLVTNAAAIKAVQDGKREISLGYDATYVPTGLGEGYQKDIIVNHIALVESGRCGLRCAIGDQQTNIEGKEQQMTNRVKVQPAVRRKLIQAAFATQDKKALDEAMDMPVTDENEEEVPKDTKDESGDTHIHVHTGGDPTTTAAGSGGETHDDSIGSDEFQAHVSKNDADHKEFRDAIADLNSRMAAMSGSTPANPAPAADAAEEEEMQEAVKDEFPDDKKEEAGKARDSVYLGDSFTSTMALAEILVPGISLPTFDRAAKPVVTTKAICALRKKALDLAYHQPATRDIVEELLSGKPISCLNDMTCMPVKNIFNAAAAIRRRSNNDSGKQTSVVNTNSAQGNHIQSVADLNAKNKAYWKARS